MIDLPDMTYDEAETLWQDTDYAFGVVDGDDPINHGDATAFFLEGYLCARKRLREMQKGGGKV